MEERISNEIIVEECRGMNNYCKGENGRILKRHAVDWKRKDCRGEQRKHG